MQLIPCPNCGRREEIEFHYGGQAHVPYPAEPAALGDAEWADYLFFRDNPKGPFAERWYHSGGCRRWFNAVRDTRSYRFLAVYQPDAPRPDIAQFMAAAPPVAADRASAASSATNAVTR
ncbi:MAG: sarcosine oxidase subunit delta [Microbacteriaceae bacterium]|nr:sarcosine oxidase subunit delta [Microbacteriaceae bacterium]